MNSQLLAPLLVSLLIGWSIYRRARRSIGRQPLRTTRLWVRAAILAIVGALLLAASLVSSTLLEALAGGIVGGVALAAIGLRYTKFESTSEGRFYTPHACIGLFVIALFVARVAYRVMAVYLAPRDLAPAGDPFEQYRHSPLTLAILGVLVGYYVVYNLGVLRMSRTVTPGGTDMPA
jgi:uncharacterized membrane protein YidH (DUF202 family)